MRELLKALEPSNSGICPCAASSELKLRHFAQGLLLLTLRSLLLGLLLAYLLSVIDWFRTLGMSPLYLPFSGIGQYQPRLESAAAQPAFVKGFENFLFYFNCAFPGASRLGSGIGVIAAAFWTLHDAPKSCKVQRLSLGLLAGALIGFRLMLMISSSAFTVLGATVFAALAFAVYMALSSGKSEIPRLPLVEID
ncbi:MAG: hypothetical protein K2X27_23895 [Candidatus Obscuribacterales bacterium]|nr:hypothetical protein [Candidatus Obscuribacterales bacterium]